MKQVFRFDTRLMHELRARLPHLLADAKRGVTASAAKALARDHIERHRSETEHITTSAAFLCVRTWLDPLEP
jgi:hypothetical protein